MHLLSLSHTDLFGKGSVEVSLPQYKSKKEGEEMKEQPDYSGCTK